MGLCLRFNWPQLVAAVLLLTLAVIRVTSPLIAARTDTTFTILLAIVLVLVLVPLDKIRSFKAGGVEFSLDSPQVQGALASFRGEQIQDVHLRRRLELLSPLLPMVANARVLWVDDRPEIVVGERRLLRALGLAVVPAISSGQADEILDSDSDFDLIVSDVQRLGETYKETGGVEIHEGVNFIKWLRASHKDPAVRALPVIFYAAYDWPRLVAFTAPVRDTLPEPEIANSVVDFISKVIVRLGYSRENPTIAPPKEKPATFVRELGTAATAPGSRGDAVG